MTVNKKNEPQLSAKMEKRFIEEANKISLLLNKELNSVENIVDGVSNVVIEWGGMMHLFATALEEQRASVIADIESWLESNKYRSVSWQDALRAKLQEMKGGK